jgi:hypothetical protein
MKKKRRKSGYRIRCNADHANRHTDKKILQVSSSGVIKELEKRLVTNYFKAAAAASKKFYS